MNVSRSILVRAPLGTTQGANLMPSRGSQQSRGAGSHRVSHAAASPTAQDALLRLLGLRAPDVRAIRGCPQRLSAPTVQTCFAPKPEAAVQSRWLWARGRAYGRGSGPGSDVALARPSGRVHPPRKTIR